MKKLIIALGLFMFIVTLAPLTDKGNIVTNKGTKIKQHYVVTES